MRVCVRARVRVCASARAHVRVRMRVWCGACVHARARYGVCELNLLIFFVLCIVAPFGGEKNQTGMPAYDTRRLSNAFLRVTQNTDKGKLICLATVEDAEKYH